MKKLDYSKKLDFDKSEILTPELVFSNFCNEIDSNTMGFIKSATEEYKGFIESYTLQSSFARLGESLMLSTQKDIQEDLGEIGDYSYKNEFYIFSPKINGYKFRICFYEYGLGGYPVKVVLEQGIADELSGTEGGGYIKKVCSQKELEILIDSILNTNRVIEIMQELIDATRLKGTIVDVPVISDNVE